MILWATGLVELRRNDSGNLAVMQLKPPGFSNCVWRVTFANVGRAAATSLVTGNHENHDAGIESFPGAPQQ
jgi:hypothetical protein